MKSNKTEADTRQIIQLKIAELEEKSALLKDYTWLLKVSGLIQAVIDGCPPCPAISLPVLPACAVRCGSSLRLMHTRLMTTAPDIVRLMAQENARIAVRREPF